MLGRPASTVRYWAKVGLLPSVRIGEKGKLLFDEQAVAEAVRAATRRPQPLVGCATTSL
jgi:DNA-binding transcriptional MerR regulator